MNFELDMAQCLLRDNLDNFLARQYRFEARRQIVLGEPGWQPTLWRRFADELGLLGAGLPEQAGGSGGGAIEHMLVMEAFGKALVVEPYLECCVLAAGVLARSPGDAATALLARIAEGSAIVVPAWSEPVGGVATQARRTPDGWQLDGRKAVAVAAPWATHLIVSAQVEGTTGTSLFVVPRQAQGLALQSYPTIDGRRAADLECAGLALTAEALLGTAGASQALLEQMLDEGAAAVCAEALGVMARLHADTLAYVCERRQFGQAIAGFQVIQHRLVAMHLKIELARAATVFASLSLSKTARERALAVSTAKVTVAEACRFVAQNAVQLHGGMGMTDELPLGSYFKRATAIEREFGDVDHHLRRHARLERVAA
ncbi:acyl-CoA dehydrogenase family protein [Solimonas terrae]|uniref:Pimeloyl-CoA dehydrogenase small subunit n=1 Tax=Solimonas terrae TaxID=1396819 RepID=A0A6M2BQ24_9GAMM|nr:acyl-CoA dehydrogenase [Solimonas terrae]NGY04321.1 pimeloyl-CoA dehydrogenase small subunit [Solimonas terrae]